MTKEEIKKKVAEVMASEPDSRFIKSVSLFGSFLHGNEGPESDVDLLFDTRHVMTLFQIGGIQYRLQEKLGRKVDFVPAKSVIRQLKATILPEAEMIYERK